ncbi:HNH endonuclease [Xenorhabdus bovienii]|uniref:HNH endonuclease n=1 Tax=Xenorhabdus bovienii TaxID=40576 RepID=UPI00237C741E|nr:HNH endonuclease [Xenorhabdus bovienii]MDE1475504.1 HNH endonuclease [Xenorhabdus bovienii]
MNIDHIDRCRSNNEIQNLRLASHYENSVNKGKRPNNKSGVKGVNWEARNKKWKAQIQADGRKIYLGLFEDIELAEIVVMAARDKLHGEFACHS